MNILQKSWKIFEKAASILAISAAIFAAISLIYAEFIANESVWLYSCSGVEIQYNSLDSCSEKLGNEGGTDCSCGRIDGPFGIATKIFNYF